MNEAKLGSDIDTKGNELECWKIKKRLQGKTLQPSRDDPIRTGDLAPPRRRMEGVGQMIVGGDKELTRARSKIVVDGVIRHRAKTCLDGDEKGREGL